MVAALAVGLVFWPRHDLPAHLVAGGGLAWLLAAAAPSGWARAVGWAAPLVVLVAATFHEVSEVGAIDLADVAFTGAGALLVARSAEATALDRPGPRLLAAAAGAGALGFGLWLRYGA